MSFTKNISPPRNLKNIHFINGWLSIFMIPNLQPRKMVLSPCSIHLKNMVVFGVVNLLWCFKWNGRNTEVFAATWFQAGRGAVLKKRLNPLVRQVIPRYTPINWHSNGKKRPFEYVCPIKNGDFPLLCGFTRGSHVFFRWACFFY